MVKINIARFLASQEATRQQIFDLIRQIEGIMRLSPAAQGLNAMTAVFNCDGIATVESGLDDVFKAMAAAAEKSITDLAGHSEKIRNALPQFWILLENTPPEAYQELGETIASQFDSSVRLREKLRDGAVKFLQDHGYKVAGAVELDREIRELQSIKAEMLHDWPWDDRPLPPVDHSQMRAEARAAYARGEKGIPVEDIIRELEGDSSI